MTTARRNKDLGTWVVVGATGFLGQHVAATANELGAAVRPMTAPRITAPPLASTQELLEILGSSEMLGLVADTAEAFGSCDVVINTAGLATPDATESCELYGANTLLPAVLAAAAGASGARRYIHVSSAAVQGRLDPLDERRDVWPLTPYARSKAAAESLLLDDRVRQRAGGTQLTAHRPTSVHGAARPTTQRLARLAASRIASVAGKGDRPTPVTTVTEVARATCFLAGYPDRIPDITVQPSYGYTTGQLLRELGGREPVHLPEWLCRLFVGSAYAISGWLGGSGAATVRRLEILWLGQNQSESWISSHGYEPSKAHGLMDDG